jgi:predicted transcriptional regulator
MAKQVQLSNPTHAKLQRLASEMERNLDRTVTMTEAADAAIDAWWILAAQAQEAGR